MAGSEILELAAVRVCRLRQYQQVQKGIRQTFLDNVSKSRH